MDFFVICEVVGKKNSRVWLLLMEYLTLTGCLANTIRCDLKYLFQYAESVCLVVVTFNKCLQTQLNASRRVLIIKNEYNMDDGDLCRWNC